MEGRIAREIRRDDTERDSMMELILDAFFRYDDVGRIRQSCLKDGNEDFEREIRGRFREKEQPATRNPT